MQKKLVCAAVFGLAARAALAGDGAEPAPPTVTVTAKKETVARKLDRTVYDASALPRAANGSAQDVLQATPGVAVTADGQITVRGSTQVTVLVDGKPTALLAGSAEDRAVALQTMSGAGIASVEVITNPSAAQNANGGAIVNIVLKRNRKPGAHAQLRGSATDQGLWNTGASGDATRGPLSVHASLAYRHDGTLKIRGSQVDWNDPLSGLANHTVQTSRVFVRRVVESAALGADYALGATDSVSVSARHDGRRSRPLFDVLVADRAGTSDTIYHRISEGPNKQSDDSASVAYSRQGNGTALKAAFQHSATRTLVDKSYRDVFVEPVRANPYSHGATGSARRLDQATLDWSGAAMHGQWGAGADLQDRTDDIGNYQARLDPATGTETPDPSTTSAYGVTTTTRAAYVTDKVRHGDWEALVGARAERMASRVDPVQGAAHADHWQAVNPSVHVRRAFGDDADVTLSYRGSLQMPDPRDLNPFTTYVDAQNRSRGNPALRPQRLGAWELDAHAQAAHVDGNVGLFYRTSRDTVVATRTVADDVVVTSKDNGGHGGSAGITGSLDWTPVARLHLGVDGGAYRVVLDTPDVAGPVRQHGIAGYVNVRAGYSAGHDDLSLDAHAQSAGITPLGRYGPASSVNVTWKHALDRTLSLTVNANDIFDGSLRTYRTDTGTFHQGGFDHFVARRVYVGFVKTIE
jgi:hypothetical protein